MEKYGVVREDQPREEWENEGGNPDPLKRVVENLPEQEQEDKSSEEE